jgi:hypothetical protein
MDLNDLTSWYRTTITLGAGIAPVETITADDGGITLLDKGNRTFSTKYR